MSNEPRTLSELPRLNDQRLIFVDVMLVAVDEA